MQELRCLLGVFDNGDGYSLSLGHAAEVLDQVRELSIFLPHSKELRAKGARAKSEAQRASGCVVAQTHGSWRLPGLRLPFTFSNQVLGFNDGEKAKALAKLLTLNIMRSHQVQ